MRSERKNGGLSVRSKPRRHGLGLVDRDLVHGLNRTGGRVVRQVYNRQFVTSS